MEKWSCVMRRIYRGSRPAEKGLCIHDNQRESEADSQLVSRIRCWRLSSGNERDRRDRPRLVSGGTFGHARPLLNLNAGCNLSIGPQGKMRERVSVPSEVGAGRIRDGAVCRKVRGLSCCSAGSFSSVMTTHDSP